MKRIKYCFFAGIFFSFFTVLIACDGGASAPQKVVNPVFNISSGTYDQDISISLSCDTEGASIYYTIGESTPTTDSSLFLAGDTIDVFGNGRSMTIHAIAVKEGMKDSDTVNGSYVIAYNQVSTPTLSLASGNYSLEREITIESATEGAEIRYTLDGSEPTEINGFVYSPALPIQISGVTELEVKAFKDGKLESELVEATYDITYNWAKSFGSDGFDTVTSVAIDSLGNMFIAGSFENTIDFGAAWGSVDEKTSIGGSDIFIMKINSDGSYGSTVVIGGYADDECGDIEIDSNDNIYIAGLFSIYQTGSSRDVNFGLPWGANDIKTITANGNGIFITKINSDNSYGWTKVICETGKHTVEDMEIDKDNNIFVGGNFYYEINFAADWGLTKEAGSASTDRDTYLMKINSDGSFGWVKSYGGEGDDVLSSIACDISGYVYTSGKYINTQSTYSYGYIRKWRISNGSDIYSKHICQASNLFDTMPLVIDKDQNMYYSAEVSGDINFGGQWGVTDSRTGLSPYTVFVTKINSSGSYQWTKTFNGGRALSFMADDASGNVYISMEFGGSKDFAADWPDVSDIKDTGNFSIYFNSISRINSDGSYGGTKVLKMNNPDPPVRAMVIVGDRLYVAGAFDFSSANANFNFATDWSAEDWHLENSDGNAFFMKVNSDLTIVSD